MSKRLFAWFICLVLTIAVWTLLSVLADSFIIPSPLSVVRNISTQYGQHLHNSLISSSLALGGLVIASAVSLLFTFLIGVNPWLRNYTYPFFILVKSTPALAIAPVLMCFVGIGIWCKVLVAASIAFFPLVVGGVDSLIWAPENMLSLARCYGASGRRFVSNIGWGYGLSGFLTGLKTAAPLSVVGALVAEFVSGGHPTGLGMYILTSNMNLQRTDVFVGAALSCTIGLTFFGVAAWLKAHTEKRLNLGR